MPLRINKTPYNRFTADEFVPLENARFLSQILVAAVWDMVRSGPIFHVTFLSISPAYHKY